MQRKENLFLSPLSTYWALLATCEGTEGKTRTEFENVLSLNTKISAAHFYSFSKGLTKKLDKNNQLNISNAIWIDQDFQIKKTYQELVTHQYQTIVKSLDFSQKSSASNTINNWISEQTNQKIRNIISSRDINKNSKLIISNAIYFKAEWSKKFNKKRTKPDNFYNIKKKQTKIDFMHSNEFLQYYENKDFQFISKPYKKRLNKSFCIMLPKEKYGITDIENKLNIALLDSIFKNTLRRKIDLTMPKFKLDKSYALTKPLKELGIKSAFSKQANFTKLSKQKPFYISCIKHKAFIEVNEVSTEAAAATSIVGELAIWEDPKLKPIKFKADHPYIFMIIDNRTNAIIFMGRYVIP